MEPCISEFVDPKTLKERLFVFGGRVLRIQQQWERRKAGSDTTSSPSELGDTGLGFGEWTCTNELDTYMELSIGACVWGVAVTELRPSVCHVTRCLRFLLCQVPPCTLPPLLWPPT